VADDTKALWREYRQKRDQGLRDRLILTYAPLVKYVAGRLGSGLPAHVEEGDLVSYGLLGLIGAIERYDPDRDVKFETYAISRIKGSIIDELRAMDWVPRSVRARARDIERAIGELEARLGRQPSDEELAQKLGLTDDELRRHRGTNLAMVFQDPSRSLNPTMKVGNQIAEAVRVHQRVTKAEAKKQAIELLRLVHIPVPGRRFHEYPHQLSGGMRQRIMIAIALACRPRLLIADEATTALDVTTQAQIMELLLELRAELGMTLMLISHDLGLARSCADEVIVMYAGQIVEQASTPQLFTHVRMPYTQALFEAIPRLERPAHSPLLVIGGRPPDLSALPAGCSFAPRCRRAADDCRTTAPPLAEHEPGHRWACWHPVGQGGSGGMGPPGRDSVA